jgi:3-hydroxy-9,10-secoandrosta-1,3,5(10)-triene-9,17-dione monooxygenase reductase component
MERPVTAAASLDPLSFRKVLGHYPTGVCVVTARQVDGSAVGLAVGSFTSVSLDPPLILFCPDKSSTSWPKIEPIGHFCVNILAHDQRDICDRFASKGGDKFAGLEHRLSTRGTPILDDVVAWIDCALHAVHEAGDHFIVLGRVLELNTMRAEHPLVFFQGGYGRFSPLLAAELGAAKA